MSSKGYQQQNGGTGPGNIPPDDFSDDDSTPLTQDYDDSNRPLPEDKKAWDLFDDPPIATDSGSMANQRCLKITIQITKAFIYLLVFMIMLVSGVVAKGTILFMTSQIKSDRTVVYCNLQLGREKQFVVTLPEEERIAWIWCLIIAFAVPEIGTLFRSVRICVFKSWKRPLPSHFLLVFIMETFHVIGTSMLFIGILPDLDAVKGAMLTNCVCFVPGFLAMLSRNKDKDESRRFVLALVDLAALAAQATGFVVWPLLDRNTPSLWLIPAALILTSCRWWENYVSADSPIGIIKQLGLVKQELRLTRYFTYIFISIWKIIAFFISSLIILHIRGYNIGHMFTMLGTAFGDHPIVVQQVKSFGAGTTPDLLEIVLNGETEIVNNEVHTPIYVLLLAIFGAYFTYTFGKFACKIMIQGFSYAFPVNLIIPVYISLLIAACGLRNTDPCFFHGTIPDYLFYESPPLYFLNDFISKQYSWVWLLWLLSQTWFTLHIWTPKCERLASTEKLFVVPMYDGLLIDQSMGLNRKRDDYPEVKVEDLAEIEKEKADGDYETIYEHADDGQGEGPPKPMIKSSDRVTRIYACATMWHEEEDEMMEFMKSILRLDQDQSAYKIAHKFLKIIGPDYYEFETHIFFDDAFELADNEKEQQINKYVKTLVRVMSAAAAKVHVADVYVRPPKKYATPYGGRLVWSLPGKTKVIAHLKDKDKIRNRKRWSQVMYMYYLLGHRLMELPISVERKEMIGENTYLLTLDGDIDFQPNAVKLLVDLMRKNKNLGAACGRIHPVGSGPMVWYQMFEYAIGHWLQKATEHMIGCVLCSPGCFSLFRGKALMDDNVMKKYTTKSSKARHYVQYDQGEDRWLCTLLLQRGYRVEYSAASDAYTHAPEGFNEFYSQRRRWVPSTIANIMDLLMDAKRTIKINDNISLPYISYQILLMGGTILGPGTIFLMLVGAFVAAFKIDNWTSFYYNIIPILFFMFVCFTCSSKLQLLCAQILSTGYAMIMMAVIVGTALQLGEDGVGSPSAIFLISLSSSFFIAACLHPQEFWCIVPGIIYLLSIPSMYLLLILYSIINLNDVTWGTREGVAKKTKKQLEQEKKEAEEAKKKAKQKNLLSFLKNGAGENDDEDSSIVIGIKGLFKFMLCTHEKPSEEKQQLAAIAESLEQLSKRLETIERAVDPHGHVRRRASSVGSRNADHLGAIGEDPDEDDDRETDEESTASPTSDRNRDFEFNARPYWVNDPALKGGEYESISMQEEIFWKELLQKYLYPLDEDKAEKAKISSDLKELRDKSVFAFFMLNALFVLIVFLLQLNKDLLHVKWPFGVKTNVTLDEASLEVHITKEYLQLEPIGLVFVFFFALILVIQFTAMLFHRFGTFAHILASTNVNWTCKKKKEEDLNPDEVMSNDVLPFVKQLQKLNGLDRGDYEEGSGTGPGRRKTIRNLEKSRKKKTAINTLDVAFRRRFFKLDTDGEMTRNIATRNSSRALKVIEGRRNDLIAAQRRKSQMQTLGANNIYGAAGNPLGIQPRPTRSSQISVKDVFENHPAAHTNAAYEADESPRDSLRMQSMAPWRDSNNSQL